VVGVFFYWRRLRRIKSPGETRSIPFLGEPTRAIATLLMLPATIRDLQPSKRQVPEHIQVANEFPPTSNGHLDHHAKLSTLRRKAERVNASNGQNSSGSNQETRVYGIPEEGILGRVEHLTPEIQVQDEVSWDVVIPPPPYADGLEAIYI